MSPEEAVVVWLAHSLHTICTPTQSDRIGSIARQSMGAVMDFESIPDRWIQRLQLIDTIEEMALDFNGSITGPERNKLHRVYGSMAE
ncbi:hypothetical protein FIM08_00825 [SAR202 cluster bacterium AC-647-N09_OGT_505m]|nr:hypothetical protein [SAR202 cluster bacterium AC-647-N09_OGT_505m]